MRWKFRIEHPTIPTHPQLKNTKIQRLRWKKRFLENNYKRKIETNNKVSLPKDIIFLMLLENEVYWRDSYITEYIFPSLEQKSTP